MSANLMPTIHHHVNKPHAGSDGKDEVQKATYVDEKRKHADECGEETGKHRNKIRKNDNTIKAEKKMALIPHVRFYRNTA